MILGRGAVWTDVFPPAEEDVKGSSWPGELIPPLWSPDRNNQGFVEQQLRFLILGK